MIHCADLFAGAGGTSTGLVRAALAKHLTIDLIAINHWPIAVATHSKNHPWARHMCADLSSVDPSKVVPGGKLNILVASPECFPEGTLILTESGLTPIEDVKRGALVLTHKGRWRAVTNVIAWKENRHVLCTPTLFKDRRAICSRSRPMDRRLGSSP